MEPIGENNWVNAPFETRHPLLRYWIWTIVFSLTGLFVLSPTGQATDLALIGARVYPTPTAEAMPDAVVLIHGKRIIKVGPRGSTPIPASFEKLDESGKVLTAGFWNSHVHLIAHEFLEPDATSDESMTKALIDMFTRWGFTTVFDLASTMRTANEVRTRKKAGRVVGPQILTVGDPFYPKGGTPAYAVPFYREFHLPSAEILSIPKALARVDRQIARGADGVKLFTGAIVNGEIGVLPMPLDQARAIASEAHRLGKPVFAHPTNTAGLDVAIDAGVDILAHVAPLSGPWTEPFIRRLEARHMAVIPTLTLFVVEPDPATPIELCLQQLKAQVDSGGDVLFGTDAGFINVYDTTQEYQLMGRVMDWRAILASLTTTPARRFGQGDVRGRIEPGFMADLLILNGDPASDVSNFARVNLVVEAGKVIWQR